MPFKPLAHSASRSTSRWGARSRPDALNGSSPKTGRAIAREILREGPEAYQELRALVTEAQREKRRGHCVTRAHVLRSALSAGALSHQQVASSFCERRLLESPTRQTTAWGFSFVQQDR
jgi:hypothetical protein